MICYEHCQGVQYSHQMMNIFLIVNITPTIKRQFKERISLCLSIQKLPCFSLPFGQEQNILGHSFERITNQFVLKATMVFPIPARQSRQRNVNT